MTDEERVSLRDLAEARERLARLELSVQTLGINLSEVDKKLDAVLDGVAQAKGAWAVGKLGFGAACTAIGSVVTLAWNNLPQWLAHTSK